MKAIIIISSTLILFTACSQVNGANPSQNKAVNNIAGKKEKKSGFMQQALDKWLAEEWSPVVSGATPPAGDTKVKIVTNEDGSAKLVEADSGVVLKEMTKEEAIEHKEVQKHKTEIVTNEDGSANVVEVSTGRVVKEMTKEQVIKQKEVQEKYKAKDRNFTLQEYIDKMAVYNSTHVSDKKDSHTKKINSMPVIGTIKR